MTNQKMQKKTKVEKSKKAPRQRRVVIRYVRESLPVTRLKTAQLKAEADSKKDTENEAATQEIAGDSDVTRTKQLLWYKDEGQGISFAKTNSKRIRATCNVCGATAKMSPLSEITSATVCEKPVSENCQLLLCPWGGESYLRDPNVPSMKGDEKCEKTQTLILPVKDQETNEFNVPQEAEKSEDACTNDFHAGYTSLERTSLVSNALSSTSFLPEIAAKHYSRKRTCTEIDEMKAEPLKRKASEREILNEGVPDLFPSTFPLEARIKEWNKKLPLAENERDEVPSKQYNGSAREIEILNEDVGNVNATGYAIGDGASLNNAETSDSPTEISRQTKWKNILNEMFQMVDPRWWLT